jgi:hypothetical protein
MGLGVLLNQSDLRLRSYNFQSVGVSQQPSQSKTASVQILKVYKVGG